MNDGGLITPDPPPPAGRQGRNVVTRADGKLVNVNRQMGQLFVCATGCCCGNEKEGKPPGHFELYHNEWERRRIRNKVHLNMGGCLGPCPLANVCMLMFDGRSRFFHSMNTEQRIIELYDYIDTMIAAGAYLPPPASLQDFAFSAFTNDGRAAMAEASEPHAHGGSATGGGILFLTHADTDVLSLTALEGSFDEQLPPVRVYNVGYLQEEAEAVAFFDSVVPGADIVLVKLHGGAKSLPGFDHLANLVRREGQWLVAMPGTDDLDPELTAASNAGVPITHEAKAYFQLGGLENFRQCLYFLSDHLLATGIGFDPPAEQPRCGVYHPALSSGAVRDWRELLNPARPTIGVTFYRSYWLAGDTAFVDCLVKAGEKKGVNVLPVFAYSLKDQDEDGQPAAFQFFVEDGRPIVDAVVNTMSFAMGSSSFEDREDEDWAVGMLNQLDVPQLQAMHSSVSSERWRDSESGLTPLDVAMNVAIPELDGRIITVPLAFKEEESRAGGMTGTPVIRHVALEDRAERVMGLAARLAALRHKPNGEKRIAIVLTNHSAKAARIANAVGLDSPASLLHLLGQMRCAGYEVGELPVDSDTLMHDLIERGHYDREFLSESQLANAAAAVPAAQYAGWFAELPKTRSGEMTRQWGAAPGQYYIAPDGSLALAGLRFGNVFVAVQPPRGYGMDKTAAMHKPDLAPPFPYHALYRWLNTPEEDGGFGADAMVHMGKHGSLEWLPGKGIGVSEECYPDLFLEDMPLVYPFIVDDPGEGAAAKRRAHATIVDHLPPPMTSAGAYGQLEALGRLVDEYYLLERTDPAKLPLLQRQIWTLLEESHLAAELGALLNADSGEDHTHEWDATTHEDGVPYSISDLTGNQFAHLVEAVHAYLHELGAAPIRDGLHVLGHAPEGEPLIDTLMAMLRIPNGPVPSLRDSLGAAYGFDIRGALDAPGERLTGPLPELARDAGMVLEANADALEAVNALARGLLVEVFPPDSRHPALTPQPPLPTLRERGSSVALALSALAPGANPERLAPVVEVLEFASGRLLDALQRTDEEIGNVLRALEGRYVPSGPSGAPTRGMAHVLPTGRNFYTVDPRSIPSSTAWAVGEQLAAGLLAKYQREEGAPPKSVGISIWGTAAMRTSGDDIAQVFALLGVRPVWQAESRRVTGIEIVPLAELGRPRIDVVCRISGFFRDAFPHTISLIDEAIERVSKLDEPLEQNFVRANRLGEAARLEEAGSTAEEAWRVAGYRIFGSKPGTYGAGILQLIDDQLWKDDADLAATYVNWGGYAYTSKEFGTDARDSFRSQLSRVAIAVKNQDNREHDIFDSDDYFQFHGGMIATIRALTGKSPRAYFGDTQDPASPRVRDLKDEANRVFRSRVVNPKWIKAIQRHGYKGGLELAATVDYLFGYDATAGVLEDWQYARVAEVYALDPEIRAFLERSNPWAFRDIATRLLEAAQRGLWGDPGELRGQLEAAFLSAEGAIEGKGER